MRTYLLAFLAIILIAATAGAWERPNYTDAEIVSRAQLIVVGRIKPDTLTLVEHKTRPGSGLSWEHHGVLIITEVLKGRMVEKEIPVIIHYGLDPVVGGEVETEHLTIHQRSLQPDYPKDVIEIFDTGSTVNLSPIADDIRKDHIWLLRVEHTRFNDGEDALGIYDPEDIQPLTKRPQLQALIPKA